MNDDPTFPSNTTDGTTTNGLAHLVLSVINLIHELLEKQTLRRMDNGTLTDDEIERLGQALQQQAAEIEHLCEVFDLSPSDLSLPLGTIETSAME
ncbi:gas vesicle protein K [Salisaeta longa]|uniref:gas vesicle protein K n=1 Tax=Salisaeta longa TaxID=503170 RepID=UPI0003B75CD8|nr:gas vesicle protein K [Salisaeta longa]